MIRPAPKLNGGICLKKTMVIFLALVMVLSAGLGTCAADTNSTNGTDNQTVNNGTDPNDHGNNGDHGQNPIIINNVNTNTNVNVIEITILNRHRALAAAFGGANSAAAGGKNPSAAGAQNPSAAAGGKTIPMQTTGLPILPGILATLAIGGSLLERKLRN
jgi:hypothetical protein